MIKLLFAFVFALCLIGLASAGFGYDMGTGLSSSGVTAVYLNNTESNVNDSDFLDGHHSSYFYPNSNPSAFISDGNTLWNNIYNFIDNTVDDLVNYFTKTEVNDALILKLNVTDQRYNDTALIKAVNTSFSSENTTIWNAINAWGGVHNGTDGINGTNGKDGKDGIDGLNGTNGVNGSKGDKGDKGEKGDKGDAGINGTNGIDGINGTNGVDINATNFWNKTEVDNNFSKYYLKTNPFGFWNNTFATFNKSYADTVYAPIKYGDDWNKSYADELYYGIDNPFAYYNSTDFDIADYYLESNPFSFYNSTDFDIDDYYLDTNPFSFYNSTTIPESIDWSDATNGTLALASDLTAKITWANAVNGTLALTSALASYLPLAGGAMSGLLNMTNQNVTWTSNNKIWDNTTCVIIGGSTSTIYVC